MNGDVVFVMCCIGGGIGWSENYLVGGFIVSNQWALSILKLNDWIFLWSKKKWKDMIFGANPRWTGEDQTQNGTDTFIPTHRTTHVLFLFYAQNQQKDI